MELYILRHAPAEIQGETWRGTDAKRPLSSKGEKKMKLIALAMKHLDLTFDLILSSPSVRALRSAEIAAKKLRHSDGVRISKHLKIGGNAREVVRNLLDAYPGCGSVLLVGHEPGLSRLISVLLTGQQSAVVTMKKGALCKLTVPRLKYGRCATLDWLIGLAEILALFPSSSHPSTLC